MWSPEYLSTQEEIIRLQSEAIDALFLELLQYKNMDEIEGDKAFDLIKEVAEKKRTVK
ncbi:MAG: hypothetical protein K6G84_07540 [Lachnospiraceae bacterium]|nr:hypothetical protein [Lachnospiraceae bacterium]